MKNKIQQLLGMIRKPSEFTKNIMTVFSGTALTQAIPIITAPILTRIYSPADYGLLGVYISLVSIIGVFSTFAYHNAIIIAKDEKEYIETVALSYKLIIYLFVCCLTLILLFHSQIFKYYKIEKLKYFFYLLPLSVFSNGVNMILGLSAIRFKLFKESTYNRVLVSIITALTSIIFGLCYKSTVGLFFGFFLGQFISSYYFYITIRKKGNILPIQQCFNFNTNEVANKFKDFPKYVLPSEVLNNTSTQLPIYIITGISKLPKDDIGHYNTSNRMLGLPTSVLSSSVAEVFKQRAASDFNETGSCTTIFVKTFKTLSYIAIVPFTILFFLGEEIFSFVFGEQWRTAGQYTEILSVLFFFRFIISPLSYVIYIAQKQKISLYIDLLLLATQILLLLVGGLFKESIPNFLIVYTIVFSAVYLITLGVSYYYSNPSKRELS